MTQRYEDDGTAPTHVLDFARECAAREFIHSVDIMGGRVRRRAGTMDPPPSTSFADERRGEGARDENDDDDDDDDEDGRSIRRGFIHAFEWFGAWARAQRGGDT